MKDKILDILADLCDDDTVRNSLDVDLFEEDLMDSLAFAEFLFSVEENFGVIIAPSEIAREDINTPNKIITLIEERMAQ